MEAEEVAGHEEKDSDWGGGILPPDPGVHKPARNEERRSERLTTTCERGMTSSSTSRRMR